MQQPQPTADPELLAHVRHVVAVSSGKGGVGKSTVAVNLAVALRRQGRTVGLMDGDVHGPNVPMMMGLTGQPDSAGGKIIPMEKHGVKVMSLGLIAGEDTPIIWRGPIVGRVIQQFLSDVAWGKLDALIVDLPPGTGDAQLTLAQTIPLRGAVIVTTPQEVALEDVHRSIAMFERVEVPVLGVVENMSEFVCPCCGERVALFGKGGADRIAATFSLPVLGRIPILAAIREGGDDGRPVALDDSDTGRAFADIASTVWEALESQDEGAPEISVS